MKTKIFNSIHEVPKEQWKHILKSNHSITYNYEFWEVIEESKLNDFSYKYVIFYSPDDTPVALTCFYTVTTDMAIFASKKLRFILQKIRKTFPHFLIITMLECGTPITLNGPMVFGVESSSNNAIQTLIELLIYTARQQRHFLIVVRDFEPVSHSLPTLFKQAGFHFVDSLPTTYMDITWTTPNDYLSSMKSYYRSKLIKHLSVNKKQGINHLLIEDFADLAETLCEQWLVVHSHASEYQREILTPEFYREFSLKLGSHSKVLLFYRDTTLIGHALLLMDGHLLRWLYFGRKDACNDSLYIYVAHKVIETAILLGAKQLELGLTTYPIKKDLGAYMSPIKLALRSPLTFINPFISIVYPLLNRTTKIKNKTIFKKIIS
jgi:predicted N-acyltransferase